MSSRKRKGTGIDVDRLGSWYQPSKVRKVTPIDKVTAIMAPRNSVTGAQARDQLMTKTLAKAPKVGNRMFKRVKGGKVGRKRKGKGLSPSGISTGEQARNWYGPAAWDKLSKEDQYNKMVEFAKKVPFNQRFNSGLQALSEEDKLEDEQYGSAPNGTLGEFTAFVKNLKDAFPVIKNLVKGAWDSKDNPIGIAKQGFTSFNEIKSLIDKAELSRTERRDAIREFLRLQRESTARQQENDATSLGGEQETAALRNGGKLGRVHNLMRQATKISNRRGNGVVYPIPDIKLQPELAKIIAMVSGSSPLDHTEKESLSNLHKHHYNLIKNYKHHRKLPGLNPRRKITKGGRTFVSLRNILVTPEAAP